MGVIAFGTKVLRLWGGADFSQISLRREDHNKAYRGSRIPISVTISCTYHCNLACAHCQSENNNKLKDIPTDRMLSLVDEIADAGAAKIGFTGGEPLLRNDMGEVLRRGQKRGLVSSLVSNAWLVKRRIEDLKPLSLLFLSLDGDAKTHDSIRGPGNFAKFIEAVEAARAADIPVCALTTLMSNNFHCTQEMRRICDEMGLHWMVGVIQTEFTGRSEQEFKDGQLPEVIRIVESSPNNRASKRYFRFVLEDAPLERCWAGVGYAIVAPNGRIYPCFPAQFDHEAYAGVANLQGCPERTIAPADAYEGVSIMDRPFGQAFQEMALYRRTCESCRLACHAESNYLYEFTPDNILKSFKLMRPASVVAPPQVPAAAAA